MTDRCASVPGAPSRPQRAAGPEVRPATCEDATAVAAGIEQLLAELGGEGPSKLELAGAVRELIADPAAGVLLIAEAGGELVGVLAASWAFAVHVPGRYATIQDLWVPPAWRSRAIGSGLIMALARAAGERGVRRLEVGLPKETFAQIGATEAFYRANGFQRLGPRMRRLL